MAHPDHVPRTCAHTALGAQSAVAAGIATIGNLQFVQPGEREQRDKELRDCGVVAVVTSWSEVEQLVQESST